jgi:hypothetical protein
MSSAGSVHEYVHVTFAPGQPEQIAGVHGPPSTETSMPDTPRSSDAVPLTVKGSGPEEFI